MKETIAQTHTSSPDVVISQFDTPAVAEDEQSRKRTRDADESMSPVQRRINALQANVAALEYEHKMQNSAKLLV